MYLESLGRVQNHLEFDRKELEQDGYIMDLEWETLQRR